MRILFWYLISFFLVILRKIQRYSEYIEGLPFENPEMLYAPLKSRLENLAGICLSKRYPDLVNNFMECFKVEYHRSVKKSILDHKYFVSKEDLARLRALQLFHCDAPKPPIPR